MALTAEQAQSIAAKLRTAIASDPACLGCNVEAEGDTVFLRVYQPDRPTAMTPLSFNQAQELPPALAAKIMRAFGREPEPDDLKIFEIKAQISRPAEPPPIQEAADKSKPAQKQETSGVSRRTMLRGMAAFLATVGVVGGAKALLGDGQGQGSGGIISSEEAQELYLNLKQQMEEKLAEAKAQKKPLRIFLMEGHGSVNAIAHEWMLMDIAKRLGIKQALFENSDQTVKLVLDGSQPLAFRGDKEGQHFEALVRSARGVGLIPKGMDNLWPTAETTAKAYQDFLQQCVKEEITKHHQVKELDVQVRVDPQDVYLENPRFSVSGDFSPPVDLSPASKDWQTFNGYFAAAAPKAVDAMRKSRDEAMLKTLSGGESYIAIIGKNHGVSLVKPLREKGEITLAISLPSDKGVEDAYLTHPQTSAAQKDALRWANDPANATQQKTKDFPLENLPNFIGQAIEQANNKGARGR